MKKTAIASLGYLALAGCLGMILFARIGPSEGSAATPAPATTPVPVPVTHRATPSMLTAARESEGKEADTFRATAADGASYTLGDLTMSRPLVLVFIKDGCPCSESAQPFLNRLHEVYGTRARFAGVIDSDAESATRWASANGVPFPLLLDPGLEIVRRYRVENSAYVVLVGAGGRVEKAWPGYSTDMLRDLGQRLSRMTGLPERLIHLAGAPGEMYSGCPYFDSGTAPATESL